MKKVFALLVAGVFTLAIVGCGSTPTTGGGAGGGSSNTKDGKAGDLKKSAEPAPK